MEPLVLIKDMRAGQKNINSIFIVLEIGQPTITKENREVRTFKVADQSACINASIWDEAGQILVPGDIVRMTKGYLGTWRNCLTLYASKLSDLQKIGDFCMVFNEQLNMSEPKPSATVPPQPISNNSNTLGNANNNNRQIPSNNTNSNSIGKSTKFQNSKVSKSTTTNVNRDRR